MKVSSSGRALSFGRSAVMACVALLLLTGGVWSSWETAQHVVLAKGREHGTFTVTGCAGGSCTGTYTPDAPGGSSGVKTVEESVAAEKGERFSVVVKPDTQEVVRDDTAGMLHAWVPLGGALLLAALVIGGGMRLGRTARVTAVAGCALLLAAFLAL